MATADFTIADVLAWARTKPADESYSYGSNTDCALCQFVRETGRVRQPTAGASYLNAWELAPHLGRKLFSLPIPNELNDAVCAIDEEQATFRTLVKRLEALCPDAPVPSSEWTRLDAYLTDIELASA
jgi:hypothetical protein